jgi:hypothetical protein
LHFAAPPPEIVPSSPPDSKICKKAGTALIVQGRVTMVTVPNIDFEYNRRFTGTLFFSTLVHKHFKREPKATPQQSLAAENSPSQKGNSIV